MSNCDCNSNMDIRGRCCPYLYNKQFLKCNARLDTALFHFENNCEILRELENDDYSEYTKIISKFLKGINIKYWKDIVDFTDMFIKSVEEGKMNMDKFEAIRELEFEKKIIKTNYLKFYNNTGKELCYVEGFLELSKIDDYCYNENYINWYNCMKPVWDEFDEKINKNRNLKYRQVSYDLKEIYKILDAQHAKYFKEKYFNKFQFRVGRIVQGTFFNDYDYSSFQIIKVTKTYIEAYEIYYNGKCGDVKKFTKPSQFKRFQY